MLGGMLGPAASGVFPGPALLGWLARRFVIQEASVTGLMRSLQVRQYSDICLFQSSTSQ